MMVVIVQDNPTETHLTGRIKLLIRLPKVRTSEAMGCGIPCILAVDFKVSPFFGRRGWIAG